MYVSPFQRVHISGKHVTIIIVSEIISTNEKHGQSVFNISSTIQIGNSEMCYDAIVCLKGRLTPDIQLHTHVPVQRRFCFKICSIRYQKLSAKHPIYLQPLLTFREFRSSSSNPLFVQTSELELSLLPHLHFVLADEIPQ